MATPVLPKPPAGAGMWGRIIVYLAETAAQGLLWQQYTYGTEISESTAADPGQWRRFAFHWSDTISDDAADDQVFTMDFVNLTNGDVDSSWDAGDYADFDPAINTLLASLAQFVSQRLICDKVSVYKMSFRPYSESKPFAESGPPEHVYTKAVVGGGAGGAPQVTSTVTEITLNRAHWGRMYLPTLNPVVVGVNGRLSSATVDALVGAVHAFYDTMGLLQFYAVVPTTQVNKVATRTLQVVNGIRVDDVVDAHRSRRHAHALYKKTL